jgi:hypothetical protein
MYFAHGATAALIDYAHLRHLPDKPLSLKILGAPHHLDLMRRSYVFSLGSAVF